MNIQMDIQSKLPHPTCTHEGVQKYGMDWPKKQIKKRKVSLLFSLIVLFAGCSFCSNTEDYIRDLGSENVVAQRDAIFWLGEKGKKSAALPLMNLLAHERPKVIRLEAIKALGKIGASAPVDKLVSLLEETDEDILVETIEALGKIGDRKAVKPITEILRDDMFKNQTVTLTAIWGLGNIGDKNATPSLMRLSNEKDQFIAYNATIALKRIATR